MDTLLHILQLAFFLGVLIKASDWFIESAELIGLTWGISPFIIGITIVALGTSLPELATSIASVLRDESSVVVGNVVGSNIVNISLVLGVTAVVAREIKTDYNVWHIDMPYLWGSALFFYLALQDLKFSIFEAFLFLMGIGIFLLYTLRSDQNTGSDDDLVKKANYRTYGLLLLSGVLVYIGADLTIDAIIKLSRQAGISPDIIAMGAVALGTSLPELVVSISAARKGKAAIAVGNVLGSNVFNTYVVMGIPALIGNLEIPASTLEIFVPIMLVLTILFGIIASNKIISRYEGGLLLLFYIFFMGTITQYSLQ